METTPATEPQGAGASPSGAVRGLLDDALRYWEPRRLIYNLVLTAVTVIWFAATWPHFRPALTVHSLLLLAVLGLLANVCYCAAYLADISMQCSSFGAVWRRRRWDCGCSERSLPWFSPVTGSLTRSIRPFRSQGGR